MICCTTVASTTAAADAFSFTSATLVFGAAAAAVEILARTLSDRPARISSACFVATPAFSALVLFRRTAASEYTFDRNSTNLCWMCSRETSTDNRSNSLMSPSISRLSSRKYLTSLAASSRSNHAASRSASSALVSAAASSASFFFFLASSSFCRTSASTNSVSTANLATSRADTFFGPNHDDMALLFTRVGGGGGSSTRLNSVTIFPQEVEGEAIGCVNPNRTQSTYPPNVDEGFTGVVGFSDTPPSIGHRFRVDRLVCICMSGAESDAAESEKTYVANVRAHLEMLVDEATAGLDTDDHKKIVRRYVWTHLPLHTTPPFFFVRVVRVWLKHRLVAVQVEPADDEMRERCARLLSPPRYVVNVGVYRDRLSVMMHGDRIDVDLMEVDIPPPVDVDLVERMGWRTTTAEEWARAVRKMEGGV